MQHYLLIRNAWWCVTLKEILNDAGLVITLHSTIQPLQIIGLQEKGGKENIKATD